MDFHKAHTLIKFFKKFKMDQPKKGFLPVLQGVKLNKTLSMKYLDEATYVLSIKIYRDRSRCLTGLSQSTYLDKVLKKFKMD